MMHKGDDSLSLNLVSKYDNKADLWIVDIQGEIDIHTSTELKEELNRLLNEKLINININCEELHYIDSTGLGVLIGILKKLSKDDRNIIISNPQPNISKLLKITGLDKVFLTK